jgi:hypothetical protein
MTPKRRARSRGAESDSSNLDPFLDIISNVVGILIVLAILIAISVSAATTTVYAPMTYKAPPNMTWNDAFICLEGRVVESDGANLRLQLEQFAKRQLGSRWNWHRDELNNVWKLWIASKASFQTENFCIEEFCWNSADQLAFISLQLKPDNSGDGYVKLKSGDSKFEEFLKSKDPTRDGIILCVAPSSYREFQAARNIAKAAGFHVKVYIYDVERGLYNIASYSDNNGSITDPQG